MTNAATYFRIGRIPANGISRNHRDNTPEPGVSVWPCTVAVDDEGDTLITLDITGGDMVSAMLLIAHYLDYSYVPGFVVTGDVVGTGSDGEPCLRVGTVTQVARGAYIGFVRDGRVVAPRHWDGASHYQS